MIASAPRITTTHRYQTRQPDQDLVQLARRAEALKNRGRMEPMQACNAVNLCRRVGFLVRDKASGNSQWRNDARNVLLDIERAEAGNA